jgi:hypothetical protein
MNAFVTVARLQDLQQFKKASRTAKVRGRRFKTPHSVGRVAGWNSHEERFTPANLIRDLAPSGTLTSSNSVLEPFQTPEQDFCDCCRDFVTCWSSIWRNALTPW